MKPTVRMENWVIVGNRLHGEVFGHPGNVNGQFPDGTVVITSEIVSRNLQHSVETRNTIYLLKMDKAPIGKIVYISGPVTGYADLNKPAFDAEAKRLTGMGYGVWNPADIPKHPASLTDPDDIWRYYMKFCVKALPECDEIRMLPDWQNSKGAVWEHRIAKMLGLDITYCPVPDKPSHIVDTTATNRIFPNE